MNNVFLDEWFYLITFPFLPLILHYFFSHCFVCRVERTHNLWLFYSLYGVSHMALHHSSLPGTVLLLLNGGLIIALSFLYRGSFSWRIAATLFVSALIFLSDAAMPLAYTTSQYIVNLFVSKLLMFILVLISVRIAKAFGDGSLAVWYWIFLFCCPLISVTGIIQLSSSSFFQTYPVLLPLAAGGLLIINLLIFVLCDRVLCVQSAQHKSQELELQNAYYVNQYLLTKEAQEETFKFQHDFKNILVGLRGKLQSGTGNTGVQELDALLGHIELSAGLCNSGNVMIDSILNYKQQAAGKYNIPFSFDYSIPPQMVLDTTLISVILGNVLDNAIEACQHPANTAPYVQVHMQYLNESLFIKIQNPYTHEIRKNVKGELRSTKADPHAHGLGLKNTKKLIDEHSGILDVSFENQLFQVEIVLFNVGRE